MVKWESIDELRKIFINKYIKSDLQSELEKACSEEYELKRDYNGRQILELLQNVDDACEESKDDVVVNISYKKNILEVGNTGTTFSAETIERLCLGRASEKSSKKIGNKGTGFRSLLNDAEWVELHSGKYAICFSEKYVYELFNEYRNENLIANQLNNWKKDYDLLFPVMNCPKNIKSNSKGFDTLIRVKVKSENEQKETSIKKQLDQPFYKSLLFLPNITKIVLETDTSKKEYSKITNNEEVLIEEKIDLGKTDKLEEYFVYNKKAIIDKKEAHLIIAVPKNKEYDFSKEKLYCYFPIRNFPTPIHALIHAPFSTNNSRDDVPDDTAQINRKIFIELFNFIKEVSEKIAKKDKQGLSIKTVEPFQSNKLWNYDFFNLKDEYFKILSSAKILPTVNLELISINDKPKAFENRCPDFFKGDKFEKLLNINSSDEIFNFFTILIRHSKIDYNYDESELEEIIAELSKSWTIAQQIQVFIWWNQSNYIKKLPKLLKIKKDEGEDEFLNLNDNCYLLSGDFNNLELPKWVKVPSLNKEYQEQLYSQSELLPKIIEQKAKTNEKDIARLIVHSKIFPDINFSYRDRSTIINATNSSVENYNHAIEFVKWLWDNYSEDKEWNPPGRNSEQKIKYNFPDKNNPTEPKESDFFYFGRDYGNVLADKLFDERYSPIPKTQDFGIGESELEAFKSFLRKFGVKDYPIIEITEIKPLDSFAEKYKKIILSNGDLGSSTYVNYRWNWPYIKNLEEILKNLSENEIIKWIANDKSLHNILSQTFCKSSDVKLEYEGNRQQYYRPYKFEMYSNIDNYILFLFNELPWIEINDKIYSPKYILQNFKEIKTTNKKFIDILPVITTDKLHMISKELDIDFEKVYEIYSLFSFCNEVTDLPSNEFYNLLLKLPKIKDFTKSENLSRVIYRILEKPENKKFDNTDNKRKFLEKGKLLVSYKGKLQYYPASDVYVPSQKILNKRDYPIIEKGLRTNSDNFINLFGCHEYKKEYKIISHSEEESNFNSEFQLYFNTFREYAKAYKELNSNIARYINTLNIKIINSIRIKEIENDIESKSETIISENYSCLKSSLSNWFIVLSSRKTSFNSEINKLSEIIEMIFDNIANTTGFEASKLGELFRVSSRESREFLIRKEFGSLNVLDNDNFKSEIQTSFESALKGLAPSYKLSDNEIDFENFYEINNSRKIVELFTKLDFDIADFEKIGFPYPIELSLFFKEVALDFIHEQKWHFKNVLYKHALSDEKLQLQFIDNIRQFEKYHLVKIKNSVYSKPNEIIISHFNKILNNWYDESVPENFDCDTEYNNNYKLLNPKNDFMNEIANEKNVQRMIYFNKKEEFSAWLDAKNEAIKKENAQEHENIYDALKEVIPTKRDINFSVEKKEPEQNEKESDVVSNQENKDADTKKEEDSTQNKQDLNTDISENIDSDYGESDDYSGVFSEDDDEKRLKRLKEIGNNGELLIYNYLCKEYGKEHVFPKSEAFITLGILLPGQAESGEYDISYKAPDGKIYYVEVKSGYKNRFFITPSELDFAKKNAERYKLFVVYNMKKKIPDFTEIPAKFWNNPKFHQTEIIETLQYTF